MINERKQCFIFIEKIVLEGGVRDVSIGNNVINKHMRITSKFIVVESTLQKLGWPKLNKCQTTDGHGE